MELVEGLHAFIKIGDQIVLQGSPLHAVGGPYPGLWWACQCQAMSMRRGSQTRSFAAT